MLPEQAQKITDFRQRILKNTAEGLPSHTGISAEELAEAVSILRQNRTFGAKKGGEASGKAKTAKKAEKVAAAAGSVEDKLKNLGLDLD